jgi:hypothetical protein
MKKAAFFILIGILFLPVTAHAVILGPYTGTVTDSTSGKPIEGASVLFYWTKEVPGGFEGPNSYPVAAVLVYTDKHGKYHIPMKSDSLGLMGKLEETDVIIYEPGYQAYIERIRHIDRYNRDRHNKKASSFKKKGNIVRLERIPQKFNHSAHLGRIKGALEGIDHYYDPDINPPHPWQPRLKNSKGVTIERREFLRRTEWEGGR